MANSDHVFVIDDTLNTADNLAAYVQVLERMDSALGTTLERFPLDMGHYVYPACRK